jgi:hypothetical protein
VAHGSAESGAMKDLGKPGAGELHARIDERRLETEHGFGTAAPAVLCVDSAGPIGHRASPRLYPSTCEERAGDLSYNPEQHAQRFSALKLPIGPFLTLIGREGNPCYACVCRHSD